ncbi:hypothetical protein Tco_1012491, partial [Tanacetum coccineum]
EPTQSPQYSIDHQEDLNQQRWEESKNELLSMMRSFCEMVIQQKQAANIDQSPPQEMSTPEPSRSFNFTCDDDDDDDDKEYSIPLNKMPQILRSIALVPVSSTIEPEDSLIIRDEHLSTIPEKESDEFIKFSVKDLVLIPSEPEETSESDSDCDLPCDDESLSDEDVPEDNFKIYSNPLFEFDDEYISSDINPLFDEDECFDPGGDVDEIELLLHRDPSTPKISVASILEGFTKEPSLEENDDLFNLENEWKKILYDAPIDDLITEDKVFDPRIHEKKFSPTYVSLPYEDRHYLSLTYVIRIFLPYFTYTVDSPFPLSSGSEDIIFDPDISAFYFSSLEPVAYKSLMEVCSSTCFIPNITMIWGESS